MRKNKWSRWVHSILVLALLCVNTTFSHAQMPQLLTMVVAVAPPVLAIQKKQEEKEHILSAVHPCADRQSDISDSQTMPCVMDCCKITVSDCGMERCHFSQSLGIWLRLPMLPDVAIFNHATSAFFALNTNRPMQPVYSVWRPPRSL